MSTAPTLKPRLTLDEFKAAQMALAPRARQIREVQETLDAFQNAAARTGYGTSNLLEGSTYPFNRITLNYILLTSLYRGHWLIRKVVDAIVDDMFKNWLKISSQITPQQMKRFDRVITETGTIAKLSEANKWGRLYGGAGAVIIIDGDDAFEKPLRVEDVELNSYKGLLVFDRWSGISPSADIVTDINNPVDFQLPEYYQITTWESKTYKVHHSRVLRFSGPKLPNWEWIGNMRWGASVVESMFEELKKRDNTSFNIASMIFRSLIFELQSPVMDQMLSGLNGPNNAAQRFYSVLQAQTQLMSNQGLFITGKDQALRSHQYSFGGLGEVYTLFMLDICGATEYPMTRLFGRTATGLGQGNEGDEHSYYELVGQRQQTEVNPQLMKLLPIVAMSTWGKVPADFDWKWHPVRALTNEEEADLCEKKTKPVIDAVNAGIISPRIAAKELKEQSEETGVFTNIDDEFIESLSDEVVNLGEGLLGAVGEPGADEFPAPQPKKVAKDAATTDCDEEKKLSHKAVKYEEQATGKDQCKACVHYYPSTPDPNEDENQSCQLVKSPVMPSGWCTEFKRKSQDASTPDVFPAEPALEAEDWTFQGLSINIENLAGSTRHGKTHHTRMTAPYGYIKNTEGADGDEVDVFLGPVASAPYVFVVHTQDPATRLYDEDKVILGVESAAAAKKLFEENYDRPGFFESMERMTVAELKRKLKTLRGRKLTHAS